MPTTHCPHCHREVEASDLEERFNVPKGCVCNPKEWGDPDHVNAICSCFEPMDAPDDKLCRNCEHEQPCHQ